VMKPRIPIRVFLSGASRFLGEALGRVLRETGDIVAVGAQPYPRPLKPRSAFGNERQMMHDGAWSEKLLLAVLGLLIVVAVAQIALK
jgi:nucleoside-diphosphate-sugar epimerase